MTKMPRPSNSNHTPEATWRLTILRASLEWSRAGFGHQWHLVESAFNHSLRQFEEQIPSKKLFTSEECALRRRHQREALEITFRSKLYLELRLTRWRRLFSRRTPSIDRLKRLYSKRGRSIEFEREFNMHIRRSRTIDQLPAESLFSPQERAERLFSHTRSLRKHFMKEQRATLRRFKHFERLLEALPDDPIDEQLRRLGDDYQYVSRGREWYREYEDLVDAVLEDASQERVGVNESRIRLLQNDFLLTMQARLPVYWRYVQLRKRCFNEKISALITRFSYFEQDLVQRHYEQSDIAECHTLVESFTRKIYNILSNDQRHQRNRRRVDHSRRLAEWDSIRSTFDEPIDNALTAFNRLRPILKSSPDWRHELNVFNAMMLVRRDMDGKRKNRPEEMEEVRRFIRRMVERIDSELATDVAFQSLEQELIREGRHLDQLQETIRRIGIRRRANGAQAAEEINRIKHEFIQSIWDQHTANQEGATVTPLFSAHRTRRK